MLSRTSRLFIVAAILILLTLFAVAPATAAGSVMKTDPGHRTPCGFTWGE